MNVAARPANAGDVAAMTDVLEALQTELAPLRGGAVLLAHQGRPTPIGPGLAAFVATTAETMAETTQPCGAAAIVGTIDDVVVGYATVTIETLLDGSKLGVIGELGVLLEARGVGVGEAILDDVVAFCREADCRGIDSYALPGTRETKNFFETFGFTARLLVVHSDLRPARERTRDEPPSDPAEPAAEA